MGEKRCELCQFWEQVGANGSGICHRYAPQPILSPTRSRSMRSVRITALVVLPETPADYWCKDFDKKIP